MSGDGGAVSAVVGAERRRLGLRVGRAVGAVVGFGSLAAFVCLLGVQVYRWFRDGEWTHFGVSEGLRVTLLHCCIRDGEPGRLAAFVDWLDEPAYWLGLHQVLEILPASLALFALSILGNSIYIYCSDRLEGRELPPQ